MWLYLKGLCHLDASTLLDPPAFLTKKKEIDWNFHGAVNLESSSFLVFFSLSAFTISPKQPWCFFLQLICIIAERFIIFTPYCNNIHSCLLISWIGHYSVLFLMFGTSRMTFHVCTVYGKETLGPVQFMEAWVCLGYASSRNLGTVHFINGVCLIL